jgi:hypothetical protein
MMIFEVLCQTPAKITRKADVIQLPLPVQRVDTLTVFNILPYDILELLTHLSTPAFELGLVVHG